MHTELSSKFLQLNFGCMDGILIFCDLNSFSKLIIMITPLCVVDSAITSASAIKSVTKD